MKIKFSKKVREAIDIYSFYFETNRLKYLPGQYMYLTIPQLNDDYRGPTRVFTISSSPLAKLIRITTDIRDESRYKSQLLDLKKAQELEAEGPTGTFILDNEIKQNNLFIAGGIGITPFVSALEYHSKIKSNKNFTLLYSVKSEEQAAFIEKLKAVEGQSDNYSLYLTYTGKSPKKWKGFSRRIDKDMLSEIGMDFDNYWLCGPPKMVTSTEKTLRNLGVSSNKIISEKFTGY